MIHPRIAARIFNTPLMVHPGKAAAILAGIGARVTGNRIDVSGATAITHVAGMACANNPAMGTLSRRLDRQTAGPIYDVIDGVAHIPIEGTLVHKGAWLEMDSGETSYQGIQAQVQRAMRDPIVRGVIFEVDSYGGEVSGAFETADMIFELGSIKPTIAILTDCAYSAGYLLASATRSIVVPETGGAGSIGVIAMHADFSRALDEEGVTVTILSAGAHKKDFNPFEPLPEDVAAAVMAEVSKKREIFCHAVARYREGRLTFEDAMATEANTYDGAGAVERGLADATGRPFEAREAFVKFVSENNRA